MYKLLWLLFGQLLDTISAILYFSVWSHCKWSNQMLTNHIKAKKFGSIDP